LLDGGKDDFFFLEHYVLLGNYARDPDRQEAHGRALPRIPEGGWGEQFRTSNPPRLPRTATRPCLPKPSIAAPKLLLWKSSAMGCGRGSNAATAC